MAENKTETPSSETSETAEKRLLQPRPKERAGVVAWLAARVPQLRLLAVGAICGAALMGLRSCDQQQAAEPSSPPDPHAGHAAEEMTWTCAMHPQIQQQEPGACPICGMDLIPVSKSGGSEAENHPARVTLSERAQTLAKLRTSLVRRRSDSTGAVRLLGRIEPNETTLKIVTAWTGGRIDRLFVNTTGEKVRGGQIVATLYSPEIFAAHQDLITASGQVDRMSQGAESSLRAAEAALAAARQRLSLLGVPDGELARMEKQKKPTTAVPIRTPFGGTVMERMATEGTYVTTGARLYSIAKLTSLWIQLDAYESDLPLLKLQQSVSVEVESYPGEQFEGVVTFIDPTLDPQRRTARVRVEVDNKDGRLRPGMFAQAVVTADAETGPDAPLVIPSTAPLFTGRRAIVYVEVPADTGVAYEALTVRLGPRLGNVYPVVAGLAEGDRIVTRGAFALDADLQIRGGNSMMVSPDDREPGKWDDVIHVPRAELRRIAPAVGAYLLVQAALADDDLALSQAAATKLVRTLPNAKLETPQEAKRAWDHYAKKLGEHAEHMIQANSIEQARKSFEGLSGTVVMILRVLGNPLDKPLRQAHCPMARGSQGGTWIQESEEVDNSYFGASMLSCGDVTAQVAPGEHLAAPGDGSAQKPTQKPAPKPTEGHNH